MLVVAAVVVFWPFDLLCMFFSVVPPNGEATEDVKESGKLKPPYSDSETGSVG